MWSPFILNTTKFPAPSASFDYVDGLGSYFHSLAECFLIE